MAKLASRFFFVCLLCSFQAYSSLLNPLLKWDNLSIADEIDIAGDPFLELRTTLITYHAEDCEEPPFADNAPLNDEFYLSIASETPNFFSKPPEFFLKKSTLPPEKIQWQISSDPHFESAAILSKTEEFTPKITLDALLETFLNSFENYYMRVKAFHEGKASRWSEPFAFTVSKPDRIEQISFNKIGRKKYLISWEAGSKDILYLIFGSNSQDFVPSIYFDKHILCYREGEIEAFEPNINLIAQTHSSSIEVDGSLAYYRIVALKDGQLSVPSDLIYVYDDGLYQLRDKLVFSEGVFQRKAIALSIDEESLRDKLGTVFANPHISWDTWQRTSPYLLPANHPARPILDKIFSKSRVTANTEAMKNAGFKIKGPGAWSNTVFGKHKKLKSYIVKMIPDEFPIYELEKFLSRIAGANTVRQIVEARGFQHLISVPRKWLYPLPAVPAAAQGTYPKQFILVADDMKILPSKSNFAEWKSDSVTMELLDALFVVLRDGGLYDSVQVFNIPFTYNGKIAFIDTEFHHGNVNYSIILPFLNSPNREYWRKLINSNGP